MSIQIKRLVQWTVGLLFLALLGLIPSACKTQTRSIARTEIYINPANSARLELNLADRTLLMTQGMTVMSQGHYYIKWKQLYCTRNNKEIVIGDIRGDRIETEIGPFIKSGGG